MIFNWDLVIGDSLEFPCLPQAGNLGIGISVKEIPYENRESFFPERGL